MYNKMVIYKCEVCGWQTDRKQNYNRHLNRKTICTPLEKKRESVLNKVEYKCTKCCKVFSRKYNLERHEAICTGEIVEKKEEEFNSDNLKDLLKQVDTKKLKDSIESGGINIYNINNYNNITNNININSYYNTNAEHLSETDFINCLMQSSGSVRTLLDITHFNPENPENHNVCITNINSKYLFVHNGKDWQMADQKDIIDDLIDKSNCILDIKSQEFSKQRKYEDAIKKYTKYVNHREEKVVAKKVWNEVKLLLFNKRFICMTN